MEYLVRFDDKKRIANFERGWCKAGLRISEGVVVKERRMEQIQRWNICTVNNKMKGKGKEGLLYLEYCSRRKEGESQIEAPYM